MMHQSCMLYQSNPTTAKWNFHNHIRNFEPKDALSLSTIHMMTQGKSGDDILRMANNIIKLREVQKLEERMRMSQHVLLGNDSERRIQVMTFSMEEFTKPRDATMRLLDFVLGNASPPDAKERIASEYEQSYLQKVVGSDGHITSDKVILKRRIENIVEMKEMLERYLREHPLFGRILGNIERLVEDALGRG